MNNNIQKIKILSLLVLLSATVITSLIMTQQSQELRRGAVGQFKQYFEPNTITDIKVGEVRSVKVMVDTAGEKIDAATILFCYPKEFGEIGLSRIRWGSGFDADQSTVLKLNQNNSDLLCSRLEAIIGYGGGEVKPNGLVEIATISLTGVKAGTISTLKDQVVDTNSGLKLQSGIFGTFVSGDTTNKSRFFDTVGSLNVSMFNEVTNTPTLTPTNTPMPTNTPVPGATNTPVPTATNTPVPTKDDYVLKFKVVFLGLWPEYEVCGKEFEKVNVIVESNVGTTFVANNLTLTKTIELEDVGENKQNAVYLGQISLTGFNYSSGLSIVIKGAKHIGMRYVVNDQKDCRVGKAGKLDNLTKNADNTPIFDFTGFPLQPGDVNGDDKVNAQDYVLVKTGVESGTNKKEYDLNGDCLVRSADTNYLLQTLSVKCGDTY